MEKKSNRGRKPKPEGAKYRMWSVRLPPDLLNEVQQWLPKGERSAIVAECLKRAVARKKREAPPRLPPSPPEER